MSKQASYSLPKESLRGEILVTNIAERTIYKTEIAGSLDKIFINTGNWASGMYYYSLYSGNTHIETKTLIITK